MAKVVNGHRVRDSFWKLKRITGMENSYGHRIYDPEIRFTRRDNVRIALQLDSTYRKSACHGEVV